MIVIIATVRITYHWWIWLWSIMCNDKRVIDDIGVVCISVYMSLWGEVLNSNSNRIVIYERRWSEVMQEEYCWNTFRWEVVEAIWKHGRRKRRWEGRRTRKVRDIDASADGDICPYCRLHTEMTMIVAALLCFASTWRSVMIQNGWDEYTGTVIVRSDDIDDGEEESISMGRMGR